MNIQASFTVYTAALHALILNPLLLAYFWLGLSWIDSIDSFSANKRFSSSKTSSRKPYSNSKQQEKQKHSAENTINFSYGDLFRGKTRDGPLGHLGRPPEPKPSGVATPQVSSVVQVPGKAKAESDDCPKIQALRARVKQKYGDTFFSGKPVFPPPVRGPYGEAKIRLKQDTGSSP